MKIVTVIGARPQFIKASAISREISIFNKSKSKKRIEEVIVHTGQHYDENMSEKFFIELNIPKPKYNLGVNNLSHGAMTGRMIEHIEIILCNEKPDYLLVYGDTNSTLAAAMAAVKQQIPIAHVESGLRSFNFVMPEEINRIITDRISTVLFCPTEIAVNNLASESFPFTAERNRKQLIFNVGDVMYDNTLYYAEISKANIDLMKWNISKNNYVLCTLHRAETTDDPEILGEIINALEKISISIPVIIPIHPRTLSILKKIGRGNSNNGIILLPPVSYIEMQRLEMDAHCIVTDSGGIQKEAYFHQTPCLTVRKETEWIETVSCGWNILTGYESDQIYDSFLNMKKPSPSNEQPYGNGKAAEKIISTLSQI